MHITLNNCKEFITHFLHKRNLTDPDGRAIYAYKTSKNDFKVLVELLKRSKRTSSFASCFFLYASEWWKRNYSGASWKWDPIFELIDSSALNTPSSRKALIQEGAKYWK
jgi:hypothetical protein